MCYMGCMGDSGACRQAMAWQQEGAPARRTRRLRPLALGGRLRRGRLLLPRAVTRRRRCPCRSNGGWPLRRRPPQARLFPPVRCCSRRLAGLRGGQQPATELPSAPPPARHLRMHGLLRTSRWMFTVHGEATGRPWRRAPALPMQRGPLLAWRPRVQPCTSAPHCSVDVP